MAKRYELNPIVNRPTVWGALPKSVMGFNVVDWITISSGTGTLGAFCFWRLSCSPYPSVLALSVSYALAAGSLIRLVVVSERLDDFLKDNKFRFNRGWLEQNLHGASLQDLTASRMTRSLSFSAVLTGFMVTVTGLMLRNYADFDSPLWAVASLFAGAGASVCYVDAFRARNTLRSALKTLPGPRF
jgi:hypothetical protein